MIDRQREAHQHPPHRSGGGYRTVSNEALLADAKSKVSAGLSLSALRNKTPGLFKALEERELIRQVFPNATDDEIYG